MRANIERFIAKEVATVATHLCVSRLTTAYADPSAPTPNATCAILWLDDSDNLNLDAI